jgi:hypothetical protein
VRGRGGMHLLSHPLKVRWSEIEALVIPEGGGAREKGVEQVSCGLYARSAALSAGMIHQAKKKKKGTPPPPPPSLALALFG